MGNIETSTLCPVRSIRSASLQLPRLPFRKPPYFVLHYLFVHYIYTLYPCSHLGEFRISGGHHDLCARTMPWHRLGVP